MSKRTVAFSVLLALLAAGGMVGVLRYRARNAIAPQRQSPLVAVSTFSASPSAQAPQQGAVAPSPIPVSEDEVADPIEKWKTYRDKKYGFEFRYPNELSVGRALEPSIIVAVADHRNIENSSGGSEARRAREVWRQRLAHQSTYNIGDQCREGDAGYTADNEDRQCTVLNAVSPPYVLKIQSPQGTELVIPLEDYEVTIHIFNRRFSDRILRNITATFLFAKTLSDGERADRQTYRNQEYGFEIQIPKVLAKKIRIEASDYRSIEPGPGEFYFKLAKSIWQSRLANKSKYKIGDQCLQGDRSEAGIDYCAVFSLDPYAFKMRSGRSLTLAMPMPHYEVRIKYDDPETVAIVSDRTLKDILATLKFTR